MNIANAWFFVGVVMFIIEILTPGIFFFFCLGLGAFAAGVIFIIFGNIWLSWAAFIVISLVSVYTIRPIVRRYLKAKNKMSNVDALIGKKALVVEKITPEQMGLVKVESELWKAESFDVVEAGTFVEVLRIEGSHLVVKKTEN